MIIPDTINVPAELVSRIVGGGYEADDDVIDNELERERLGDLVYDNRELFDSMMVTAEAPVILTDRDSGVCCAWMHVKRIDSHTSPYVRHESVYLIKHVTSSEIEINVSEIWPYAIVRYGSLFRFRKNGEDVEYAAPIYGEPNSSPRQIAFSARSGRRIHHPKP
ncbi:hypothetical protein DFJ77DRAFT_507693 [Powellomyces hirtus]|nr:hypothetical protein DFJ77DRAFT_507693 [Powellomyces hirtus]